MLRIISEILSKGEKSHLKYLNNSNSFYQILTVKNVLPVYRSSKNDKTVVFLKSGSEIVINEFFLSQPPHSVPWQ